MLGDVWKSLNKNPKDLSFQYIPLAFVYDLYNQRKVSWKLWGNTILLSNYYIIPVFSTFIPFFSNIILNKKLKMIINLNFWDNSLFLDYSYIISIIGWCMMGVRGCLVSVALCFLTFHSGLCKQNDVNKVFKKQIVI